MRTATLSAAALMAGSAMAADCVKGLHIIVGRGTFEPAGFGETGELAKNISAAIPGSDMVAVDYPATATNPSYDKSEKLGAQDVYDKVTKYHEECPGHKMAYLGWSQGAQIAVNAFCGAQGGLFGDAAPIPAAAVKDVVAISIFGDPSFNHTAPYAKGTGTADGLFARNGIGACKDFTDKIVSYCDKGDTYCDMGQNRSVHGMYLVNYPEQMKQFVVDKYNAAAGSSNSSTSNTTTTSTAGPTSTAGASSSGTQATTSSSPTSTSGKNAAAGLSASLVYAVPVALAAAAQMLL